MSPYLRITADSLGSSVWVIMGVLDGSPKWVALILAAIGFCVSDIIIREIER